MVLLTADDFWVENKRFEVFISLILNLNFGAVLGRRKRPRRGGGAERALGWKGGVRVLCQLEFGVVLCQLEPTSS